MLNVSPRNNPSITRFCSIMEDKTKNVYFNTIYWSLRDPCCLTAKTIGSKQAKNICELHLPWNGLKSTTSVTSRLRIRSFIGLFPDDQRCWIVFYLPQIILLSHVMTSDFQWKLSRAGVLFIHLCSGSMLTNETEMNNIYSLSPSLF